MIKTLSSYPQGFASPQRGKFKYPELWRGCNGALCPSLGPTGLTLFDHSGGGRNGTLTGMVPSTDWIANDGKMCLSFAGAQRVLGTPNMVTGNFITVSAWVNTTASTAFKIAFSLTASTSGSPFIAIGNGNTDGTKAGYFIRSDSQVTDVRVDSLTTINDGKWHHLALTIQVNGLAIGYVDGKAETSNSVSADVFSLINRASVGNMERDSPGFYFTGKVDDCRSYDRVLTPSEVKLLSLRRGIAYETQSQRNYKAAASASSPNPFIFGQINNPVFGGF